MIARVAMVSALLLVLLSPSSAQEIVHAARGPIAVRDLFPLTSMLPAFRTSPQWLTDNANSVAFSLSSAWSNTTNKRGREFSYDVETRLLEPAVNWRLNDQWSLYASIPGYWRGGGILDEPIYLWHELLHLPQGPRDNSGGRDNLYEIRGRTDSGEIAELTHDGFGWGDLDLRVSHRHRSIADQWLLDTTFGVQIPTSSAEYGLEGAAISLSGLLAKQSGFWSFYGGGQYSFLTDETVDAFRFNRHQASLLSGVEYKFESASAYAGLVFNLGLVENIQRLPQYQLYFDTAVRVELGQHWLAEVLLRENPIPEEGSADVTLYFSLVHRGG